LPLINLWQPGRIDGDKFIFLVPVPDKPGNQASINLEEEETKPAVTLDIDLSPVI
jgi:hypothetical protein